MAFIHRNMSLFDIPAARYIGQSIDTANVPHITCLTINGTDMTTGAPVTTGGVQTLDNKSLIADRTYFIDAVAPTKRVQISATGVTAGNTVAMTIFGTGTIAFPNPAGGTVNMLSDVSAPTLTGAWTFSNATASVSPITGAIIVTGGIGTSNTVSSTNCSVWSPNLATGHTDITVANVTGVTTFARSAGTLRNYVFDGDATTGFVTIQSTVASTTPLLGALVVTGGIGTSNTMSSTNCSVWSPNLATGHTDITVANVTGDTTFSRSAGTTRNYVFNGDVTTGFVTIQSTVAAAAGVGALVVAGGISTPGRVYTATATVTTAPTIGTNEVLRSVDTKQLILVGRWRNGAFNIDSTIFYIQLGSFVMLGNVMTDFASGINTSGEDHVTYDALLPAEIRPWAQIITTGPWIYYSSGVREQGRLFIETSGAVTLYNSTESPFPLAVTAALKGWGTSYLLTII